jgi:hypothetical protein
MEHKLRIVSLSDAQLDCKCGWHVVRTGTMTRQEAIKEYEKHIKYHRRVNIDKPFCVMCPKCEHGFMTDESLEVF